jgi:hypothetical protein
MTTSLFATAWWNQHSGAITLFSAVVAVLAVAVAFLIHWLQRDTKTFDWQILTDEEIVTAAAAETPSEQVKVFWSNRQLRKPRLLKIRLFNSGKREVRSGDFEDPVRIRVPGSRVMSAQVSAQRDGMVPASELAWQEDYCDVSLGLHNRGDWTDVQLLIDVDEEADKKRIEAALDEEDFETAVRIFSEKDPPINIRCVIAGQSRPMRGAASTTDQTARERRLRRAVFVLVASSIIAGQLLLFGLYRAL